MTAEASDARLRAMAAQLVMRIREFRNPQPEQSSPWYWDPPLALRRSVAALSIDESFRLCQHVYAVAPMLLVQWRLFAELNRASKTWT